MFHDSSLEKLEGSEDVYTKTDQLVDGFLNLMKEEFLGLPLLWCLNCGEDGGFPAGGHLKKNAENSSSVRPCNIL